jgi:hypothetical protein
MNQRSFTFRKILPFVLLITAFFIVSYLLTHSMLTIESAGNESRTIYIRKEGFEEKIVLKNSSRRLILPSGNYEIEVLNEDSQSLYEKNLGIFWPQRLAAETAPPLSSNYLGSNALGCVKKLGVSIVNYSCRPSRLGFIDEGTSKLIEDSGDQNYYKNLETTSLALAPYGTAFVEASKNNSSLAVKERGPGGQAKTLFSIQDFGGEVSDSTLSVFENGFTVFDNEGSTLYFSSRSAPSKYESIALDEGLFEKDSARGAQIFDAGAFVYIFSLASEEESSGGPTNGEEGHGDSATVIVVDKSRREVRKTVGLNRDWVVNSMAAGPRGTLLILLSGSASKRIYSVEPTGKVRALLGVTETVQQACSSDNQSFYYAARGGHTLYKYVVAKKASFKVYENPANSVASITCGDGGLYFVLNNERDDTVGLNAHYRLGDNPHAGPRLDAVLPVYITVNQDTIKFSEDDQGGITASLLYDADGNGSTSQEAAKAELLKKLQEKNIDITGLVITFLF